MAICVVGLFTVYTSQSCQSVALTHKLFLLLCDTLFATVPSSSNLQNLKCYYNKLIACTDFTSKVGKEFDALLIDPDAEDSPFDCFEDDTLEVNDFVFSAERI